MEREALASACSSSSAVSGNPFRDHGTVIYGNVSHALSTSYFPYLGSRINIVFLFQAFLVAQQNRCEKPISIGLLVVLMWYLHRTDKSFWATFYKRLEVGHQMCALMWGPRTSNAGSADDPLG